MEVVNKARHTVAEIAPMMDKEGNEFVVLVIKATYNIPKEGKRPRSIVPPEPIVYADKFVGEPGLSAPLYESDFTFGKLKCDVLFNACAHTSHPSESLNIKAQVGAMTKEIKVYGERVWEQGWFSLTPSKAKEFTSMPVNYGNAFGGEHTWIKADNSYSEIYSFNPIGKGFAGKKSDEANLLNTSAPSLEILDAPIDSPKQRYAPIALSVLPRNSALRICYAGTYDKHWRENIAPFFPENFDTRFFQSAPEDQQIAFPKGGEKVCLTHLMKDRPEVSFKLPKLDNIPVRVLMENYEVLEPEVVVDTLYFEPDQERFSVVWRSVIPFHRGIEEISTIAIGSLCKNWWSNKASGRGCANAPVEDEVEA